MSAVVGVLLALALIATFCLGVVAGVWRPFLILIAVIVAATLILPELTS